jgi:alpha-ketoglutarate-dependent taurine dioxygenase
MKTCPPIYTQLLPGNTQSVTVGQQVINLGNQSLMDLDQAAIIGLFRAEGVLLFRGFAVDAETFTQFSQKFSQKFLDYTGGAFNRKVINDNPTLLSVNDFNHEIKLHGEMYYQKNIPAMLWFFCAHPACQNGETTICDGKRFFEELSQPLKEKLDQSKLKYQVHWEKQIWTKQYKTDDFEQLKQICEDNEIHLKINPDESVDLHYICPAIHPSRSGESMIFINSLLASKNLNPNGVCFEDGSQIDDQIMGELNQIAEKITVEVCWQKGDILMVDNTRIMHGRRAFTDRDRAIYIRLCSPSFPFLS